MTIRPSDPAYLDKYSDFLDRCDRVNEDSFGEPTSHPALASLAERFTSNNQSFSLVTNGLLLNPRRAEKLAACGPRLGFHVSLNAATDDTFDKLTGKRFSTVLANGRHYVEAYRRLHDGAAPDLVLTFIVMKVNRHEVHAFLDLARDLGARALLASLHDRPSVPLGDFGYAFDYHDEMLSYRELVEIGDAARAHAAELGITCLLQ